MIRRLTSYTLHFVFLHILYVSILADPFGPPIAFDFDAPIMSNFGLIGISTVQDQVFNHLRHLVIPSGSGSSCLGPTC